MKPVHPHLTRFLQDVALEKGDFTLSSGAKSTFYLDVKKAALAGRGAHLIGKAAVLELEHRGVAYAAIGGQALGAVPVTCAILAAAADMRGGRRKSGFIVRNQAREHGTCTQIEGPSIKGLEVVVVDDVVTSGGAIIKAIEAAREAGATVVAALAVVDREAGGADKIRALGVPFYPLVRLSSLL